MNKVTDYIRNSWSGIATLVGVVLLWQGAAVWLDNVYLPTPGAVIDVYQRDWMFDSVRDDLLPSVSRLLAGYVLGSMLGVLTGLAIGFSKWLYHLLEPVLEFLRAVPSVAILPVAVLLLGLGDGMRIFLIAQGVFFPVLVSTAAGARTIIPERYDVAAMFQLSRPAVIRRVVLPSTLPAIATGLRIALPIAVILMVVSELVGGLDGVGVYLRLHQELFDVPAMFACVLILAALSNLLNSVYLWLERRLLFWEGR